MFYVGIVLSLFGSAFLLFSFASITSLQIIGSFLLIIIGGLCVFFAIKLRRRSLYLFFAAFFTLLGLFLLFKVSGVINLNLRQSWPLLSVFTGIALLLAGANRSESIRRIYLIPSVALIILGCFLLLFSLKITSFSFKQFVLDWCPVILVMSGIMLILFYISGSKDRM
ncbi:MAG: hypothetical protein LBB47_01195 [Spirochaetaceae bacterium]|nr:hypothetical protein [Spirochaetaceae bacterium]